MGLYVNSGNTVVDSGERYHSGEELPGKLTDKWDKATKQRFIDNGIVVEKPPKLDPVVDEKKGSAAIKRSSVPPEKENFGSKELRKDAEKVTKTPKEPKKGKKGKKDK